MRLNGVRATIGKPIYNIYDGPFAGQACFGQMSQILSSDLPSPEFANLTTSFGVSNLPDYWLERESMQNIM